MTQSWIISEVKEIHLLTSVLIEFYIGDNFHEVVLANGAEILKKLKEIKAITKLDT